MTPSKSELLVGAAHMQRHGHTVVGIILKRKWWGLDQNFPILRDAKSLQMAVDDIKCHGELVLLTDSSKNKCNLLTVDRSMNG